MSRSRDDSDDDSSESSKTLLWVILVTLGGLVLLCGGGAVALTFMWRDMERNDERARAEIAERAAADAEAEQQKPAELKTIYTFAEFQKLVQGKTSAEVERAVGKPDRVEEFVEPDWSGQVWVYERRIRDAQNPTLKRSVRVSVSNGKAIELRIE